MMTAPDFSRLEAGGGLPPETTTAPPVSDWQVIQPVPPEAPRKVPPHRYGKPAQTWAYRTAGRDLLGLVCRFNHEDGRKDIVPLTYCQQAGRDKREWRWQGFPVPRPLYGLDRLAAQPGAPVVVTEGEKAADAASRLLPDHVGVTSPGGSQAAGKADWSPLAGRAVVIWPDADDPGLIYAQAVRTALVGVAASVRILTLPSDLPSGWDAADALADGWAPGDSRLVALLASPAPASVALNGPDMAVLRLNRRPAPDFPMDIFSPCPFWREWVENTSEACGPVPVDYVAMPLLVATGALIGNAAWVSPWAGWSEPPILWAALIGSPAAGKSPALAQVQGLLRDLEAELAETHAEALRQHEADVVHAAARRQAWESAAAEAIARNRTPPPLPADAEEPPTPPRPRLMVSDATVEALAAILAGQPKGLLTVRDELAGWLASFGRYQGGGGDRAFWLEANGGRSYAIDRVKNAGKPVIVQHLAVAVLGGIQPDRLADTLLSGSDDGLLARLAMVWPDPHPPARPVHRPDHSAARAALRRLMQLALDQNDHGACPRVIRLNDAAAALFDRWRRENHAATEAASGLMASHLGKMPGFALRLALIIEYLWWCGRDGTCPPDSVSEIAVTAALGLVDEYFVPMAERAYGDAVIPDEDRHAATLARWIVKHRPPQIEARSVYRATRLPGITTAEAAKAALERLVDAGWLLPPPASGAVGRPKQIYTVHPDIIAGGVA